MRWPLLSFLVLCACPAPGPDAPPPADAGSSTQSDAGSVACFAASPAIVDFGEIETNSTASSIVRITNITSRFLKVEAPQPDLPFSVDPVPIVGLAPDASTQLFLRFAPQDGLLHFATLEVSTQDGGCPLDIPLRGLGAGRLTIEPGALDFGAVDPGQSKSLELTFTNTFRDPVIFDPIHLMPVGAATVPPFTLDFPTPLTIPPSSVTTVTVTARPTGYDEYLATLMFTGPTAARSIPLSVAGGVPVASITPTQLDVPKMEVTNFVERTLRVRNDALDGRAPRSALQFVEPFLQIRDDDGGLTAEVRPQGFIQSLMPQEEADVILQVRPDGVGLHRYTISFFTNAPANPEVRVELTVNATTLPPCSLQHPSQVQLTPEPDGGSIGLVRFTNASATSCVLDSVRLARFFPWVFRLTDGGVDQVEIPPGGVHDVWIAGPDAGTGPDAGARWSSALWFHVLAPGKAIESIDVFGPP